MRPDWDETWWDIAQVIGRRSKCERRAIGAVIVDVTNRPIAVGYNGPPRNLKSVKIVGELEERVYKGERRWVDKTVSTDRPCGEWCPRAMDALHTPAYGNCYTIHAEVNALLFADRRDYEGGTIYVTSSPCWECAKAVANSGLSRVVTQVLPEDAHRNPQASVELLNRSGLEVTLR